MAAPLPVTPSLDSILSLRALHGFSSGSPAGSNSYRQPTTKLSTNLASLAVHLRHSALRLMLTMLLVVPVPRAVSLPLLCCAVK